MASYRLIPDDIAQRFDVREWRNGLAILSAVHSGEWDDILAVLRSFRLLRSDIINQGGAKSDIAKKIDAGFTTRGWLEK